MKFSGLYLYEHRDEKNDAEDSRANEITGAVGVGGRFAEPRHGYGVAAGFAERCGENLNDPERKRNLRNLCENIVQV